MGAAPGMVSLPRSQSSREPGVRSWYTSLRASTDGIVKLHLLGNCTSE